MLEQWNRNGLNKMDDDRETTEEETKTEGERGGGGREGGVLVLVCVCGRERCGVLGCGVLVLVCVGERDSYWYWSVWERNG